MSMIVSIFVCVLCLIVCVVVVLVISGVQVVDFVVKEIVSVVVSFDKVWVVLGNFLGLLGWYLVVVVMDIVKGVDNFQGVV